jgi:trans-aconitate methyltransferase
VTLPPSYFNRMYEHDDDPWGFADRWYEERKRAITLAALPDRRYRTAFEPGCSVGVLTADLARRCDFILAGEVADLALQQAKDRLSGQPHVQFRRIRLPDEWPSQEFELIVLSEILYYLDAGDLHETVSKAVGAVAPHGTLLSVHWRHAVSDYPQTGDAVQRAVEQGARTGLIQTVHHVEADFDLAVYVRPGPGETAHQLSVAARGGLC